MEYDFAAILDGDAQRSAVQRWYGKPGHGATEFYPFFYTAPTENGQPAMMGKMFEFYGDAKPSFRALIFARVVKCDDMTKLPNSWQDGVIPLALPGRVWQTLEESIKAGIKPTYIDNHQLFLGTLFRLVRSGQNIQTSYNLIPLPTPTFPFGDNVITPNITIDVLAKQATQESKAFNEQYLAERQRQSNVGAGNLLDDSDDIPF